MDTQTVKTKKNLYSYHLSQPLNGARSARIDIQAGDGNMMIDGLASADQIASGDLEYLVKQGEPTPTLLSEGEQAILTLRAGAGGQPWFHLPWAACNGATTWQVHLNSSVTSDINANTSGGNLKIDLSGMNVTRLTTQTGGGNIELTVSDSPNGFLGDVKSGAGNVTILLPGSMEARIHAKSGLGKIVMDPRFSKINNDTYQTPGYESTSIKTDIDAQTGAGNVIVNAV